MNATIALAQAFLDGRVLSIKTAFKDFGITNLPRECGRLIERKFGVQLARVKKEGKTRYGIYCSWNEYRLPVTDYNKEGRQKMVEYIQKHVPAQMKQKEQPKTESKTELQTNKLF